MRASILKPLLCWITVADFSKKWENHWAAVTLWYTYYNFCRVHRSLRVTPAMEAGIASHVWSVAELLT